MATLGAGFTPLIASSLVPLAVGSLWLVGLAWALAFVVAAVCVMATKEGRDADPTGDMRGRFHQSTTTAGRLSLERWAPDPTGGEYAAQ